MPQPTLTTLRARLEAIDGELIALLVRRMEVARAVGAHKRAHGLATLDAAREAQVVSAAARLARDAGLPEEEVRQVFWQVVAMSRRAQQDDAR
ncbi:MAG: chorismate mutase [Gemmatimonadaceae bacterium]